MTSDLQDLAQLTDPNFYVRDPYDLYARMRREAPVFWSESGELWGLTKYEDVKYVSHSPEIFSNEYGLNPSDSIPNDDGEELPPSHMPRKAELRRQVIVSKFGPGTELLPAADPPRHTILRSLINRAFTPRVVNGLEADVHLLVRDALDQIEPGMTVDFVEALASPIPMHVTAQMLGVPREDRHAFLRWTEALIAATDAYSQDDESDALVYWYEQMFEMLQYFSAALDDRRAHPQGDLLTALVEAEADGERLSESNQLTMIVTLAVGGNETTRNLISGGAKLLSEHPDQKEALAADPSMIPNAVEEFLRCATPVITFCRTALQDVELRGSTVKRGDYLAMIYPAANRDEDAWRDPERFDIRRTPDPIHLAFGFGTHFCLGASLARRETKVVFEHLLSRFPNFEMAGDVSRLPSTASRGIIAMPVKFS